MMPPSARLMALVWFAFGCGNSAARPVGLPPPEYQQPQVEPWPPASASASPPAAASAMESAPPPAASAAPLAPEVTGGSGATLPPGTP